MKIVMFLNGADAVIGVAESGGFYYFFDAHQFYDRIDKELNDSLKAFSRALPKGTKVDLKAWYLKAPIKSIKYLADARN